VISMFATKVEVKEICGRKFRVVENGLDEAEVSAFIGSLIERSNGLASKQEHLQSLTKLLEKVVLKAQEEADSITAEAEKRANAKANVFVTKVEEEARARAAMVITKAEEKARGKAEELLAEAQQRAGKSAREKISLAERQAREIIKEAEEKAQAISLPAEKEASRIVAEAEQKAEAAEQRAQDAIKAVEEKTKSIETATEKEASRIVAEAEQKAEAAEQRAHNAVKAAEEKAKSIETAAEKEANRIVLEAKERADGEAALVKQEAEQLLMESRRIVEGEVSAIRERFKKACQGLLEEATALSSGGESNCSEPEVIAPAATVKTDEMPEKPGGGLTYQLGELDTKEDTAFYNGAVELEIMPPISLAGILQLHRHLASTPEIKTLYMKGTANKGITLRLYLQTPVRLLDILENLPEVGRAADKRKVGDRIKSAFWKGSDGSARIVLVTTTK